MKLFRVALALALLAAACNPRPQPQEQSSEDAANPSPNATLLPVPLASATTTTDPSSQPAKVIGIPADSKGRLILPEAGIPPPVAMVPNQPLGSDQLPGREAQGVTIAAEWQLPNPPPNHHVPETAQAGIDAARKLTRRLWTIDLTEYGRMRILFDSVSFPLTKYTELRARHDRYGHVLVWPAGDTYRVVPPGALRALLDERRIDVTPLMADRAKTAPSAGPRFGFPTSRAIIATATGKLQIDQAHVVNAGLGGQLLCRTLVELVGAEPASTTCTIGQVPVRAEYTWPDGATLVFEVATLNMRNDFPTGMLSVPPSGASFTSSGLPPNASGIFLTREQLVAFRSRAMENPHPRTDPEFRSAPGEGFVAVNETDALRFVLVDGVPVAWVAPHNRQYVIGPLNGRYQVQWRSFLGAYIGQPSVVEFPALFTLGGQPGPDAGADGASPAASSSAAPVKN